MTTTMKQRKQRRRPSRRVLNVNQVARMTQAEIEAANKANVERAKRENKPFVWILTSWNPLAGEFNVLGFHDGSPRVYPKDEYDDRLRPLYRRLPYAKDMDEAIRHFRTSSKNKPGPIQVDVEALDDFGFSKKTQREVSRAIDEHRKQVA